MTFVVKFPRLRCGSPARCTLFGVAVSVIYDQALGTNGVAEVVESEWISMRRESQRARSVSILPGARARCFGKMLA